MEHTPIRRAVTLPRRLLDCWHNCSAYSRYVVLALLIIFHSASNAYLIQSSGNLYMWDVPDFLDPSFWMYEFLREGHLRAALSASTRHGNLFLILTQPFYFLFGRSILSASLLNDAFFALLLVSAFLIGRELHSNSAGLLSAFLISFFPAVYGMSRVYMFDFALTAMVCLDLYILLRTRGLTLRRTSLLLAFSCGISALIKPAAIVFLAGPLIVVFFNGFRFDPTDATTRKKMENLLLIIVISLLLYSTWFLSYPMEILRDVRGGITDISFEGGESMRYPFWHPANVFHWPKVMMQYQTLYLFGALFLVALGWLIFTRRVPKLTTYVLLSFFIIPFLFFTFVVLHNKDLRFLFPLTVGISLTSALFVASIRTRALRRILVASVIIIGIWQYWMLSYAGLEYCTNPAGFTSSYFSAFYSRPLTAEGNVGLFRPVVEPFGLKETADIILEDIGNSGSRPIVMGTWDFFWPLSYLRYTPTGLQFEFQGLEAFHYLPVGYAPTPDYFLLLGLPSSGEGCTSRPYDGENEPLRLFDDQRDSYALLATTPSFPLATLCSAGEMHPICIYKHIGDIQSPNDTASELSRMKFGSPFFQNYPFECGMETCPG